MDTIHFCDNKSRIDVAAVHAFLSTQAYWAIGRTRETQQRLVDGASRVVGVFDGVIEGSPDTQCRWLLHTADMHPLYRKLGFTAPSPRVMERRPEAH